MITMLSPVVMSIVFSVLVFLYAGTLFGFKEKLNTLGVKIVAISLVSTTMIAYGIFSSTDVTLGVATYFFMFTIFVVVFRVFLNGSLSGHVFTASQFIFHLIVAKGVAISILSIVDRKPMYKVLEMQSRGPHTFIATIVITILMIYLFDKYFSVKKMRLIIKDKSKLGLVMWIQMSLNLILSLNTLSTAYEVDYLWFSGYHLIIYIMMTVIFYLVFVFCLNENELYEYKKGYETYQKQIIKQIQSYNTQTEYIKSIRKFKHDYTIMKKTLKQAIYNPNIEKISTLVKEMDEAIEDISSIHRDFSNNALVQAIIAHTNEVLKRTGGKISGNVILSENIKLSDLEICRVMANVMDNAVEAVAPLGKSGYIEVDTYLKNEWHVFVCKNNYIGTIEKTNDGITTKKQNKEKHGFGIQNIIEIVEGKHGFVKVDNAEDLLTKEKEFKITIYLPCKPA